MKISLRERWLSRPRCGYCHDDINDEFTTACQACRAPHHLDCWVENGACCACAHADCDEPEAVAALARQRVRPRRRRREPASQAPSDAWVSGIVIIEILLALGVINFGLIEGRGWLIIAYLIHGLALALYFTHVDRRIADQNNRRQQRRDAARRRRRAEDLQPLPADLPVPDRGISDRIRIRSISGPQACIELAAQHQEDPERTVSDHPILPADLALAGIFPPSRPPADPHFPPLPSLRGSTSEGPQQSFNAASLILRVPSDEAREDEDDEPSDESTSVFVRRPRGAAHRPPMAAPSAPHPLQDQALDTSLIRRKPVPDSQSERSAS